jgi:signal transduction histidine kinase
MSRWKIFPTKTSRNISVLLAVGMCIIYSGSMFLYAIYMSPKNQMPSPVEVANDFVRVVRASQDLRGVLTNENIPLFLRGKKIKPCIYSNSKEGNKFIPDIWKCNGINIDNYTLIQNFNEEALRALQQKNMNKNHGEVDYHYKVLIRGGEPLEYEVEDSIVRTALLATELDFSSNTEDRYVLNGRGFKLDFTKTAPSGATVITQVNQRELRRKVKSNINDFNFYVKMKSGKFIHFTPVVSAKRWLVIRSTAQPLKQPIVLMGFIFCACSFLIAIIFLCFWAVRNAAAPVNKFLLAAKRFGRDLQAPPMAIEGSKEMRAVIKEYNNMQAKIRRLVLDRTQMLAAISHDLRTPITRLLMRIEYLQGTEQYDKAVKDLKEMDQMIRSILAFSRDYSSNEVMERFDIGALIESICSDLQDTKMDVEYKSWDFNEVFLGRVNALRRAISNVIENAVKYGDKAIVSMEKKDGDILIKVQDHGPGVPEIEMEKVFAPFYRVDPARNPEKSGSGLGLAVSRDIIRSHAGDIKLFNAENAAGSVVGLVVVISLPASD